jgi:hypothetical protein
MRRCKSSMQPRCGYAVSESQWNTRIELGVLSSQARPKDGRQSGCYRTRGGKKLNRQLAGNGRMQGRKLQCITNWGSSFVVHSHEKTEDGCEFGVVCVCGWVVVARNGHGGEGDEGCQLADGWMQGCRYAVNAVLQRRDKAASGRIAPVRDTKYSRIIAGLGSAGDPETSQ